MRVSSFFAFRVGGCLWAIVRRGGFVRAWWLGLAGDLVFMFSCENVGVRGRGRVVRESKET